ncbi:MAG: hypothetical protein LBK82_02675 [Planctomycetaceae bacterium]|jgi:hypothetical protein|nr:hypothetical protein [Planctomycetaceae bacterium]
MKKYGTLLVNLLTLLAFVIVVLAIVSAVKNAETEKNEVTEELPELPVQITRRNSIATAFFEGKPSSVLRFTNLSDQHLSVTLMVIPKDGSNQSWIFDLLPHEQGKEIGVLETGWAFEPGETIKVSVPGYRTRTETIP